MGKSITAEEFEKIFDEGKEDVTQYCDPSSAVRVNQVHESRKVNVDLPVWMIEELDKEAGRLAINRQAVIKFWLAERIDSEKAKRWA